MNVNFSFEVIHHEVEKKIMEQLIKLTTNLDSILDLIEKFNDIFFSPFFAYP